MVINLPAILEDPNSSFPTLVDSELGFLAQSRKLLELGFPDHALLDVWNAAVHNLRRRIETYGIELFTPAVKDEPGRKKYDKDGESLSERWGGVDELVLINGATKLGVLNKKAGKALEMINWMRNHASPAHGTDSKVELEDVLGLVLILQKNLFEHDMPDPGHSPSGLFDPIKNTVLSTENVQILKDQIQSYKQADIRVTFGFMLDIICKGESPSFDNVKYLFETVWEKLNDDLKKTAGERYHSFVLSADSDDSSDKGARIRLLEGLLHVKGIVHIPDASRAVLYRHAVQPLITAKNTAYGWKDEEKAAISLAQFGPFVPTIAFEDVYQEILAVYCGNYWGRSNAFLYLGDFIDKLNTTQIMRLARMFKENARVQSELSQNKPKKQAAVLLNLLKTKLTIQANIDEIDSTIKFVNDL